MAEFEVEIENQNCSGGGQTGNAKPSHSAIDVPMDMMDMTIVGKQEQEDNSACNQELMSLQPQFQTPVQQPEESQLEAEKSTSLTQKQEFQQSQQPQDTKLVESLQSSELPTEDFQLKFSEEAALELETQAYSPKLQLKEFQLEDAAPEDLDLETQSIPTTRLQSCFFCPEISTRGRRVKRTKIHLQLETVLNGHGGLGPSATVTADGQVDSEEYEATQGFHQLCHLQSIETRELSQNLEMDYLLACAQCTQQLICLKNFIGVYSRVKDDISESVGRICQGILEVGDNLQVKPNLEEGNCEVEAKLSSFRKAFVFGFGGNGKRNDNDNNLDSDEKDNSISQAIAPIDWKLLTKGSLSSRNLYRPIGFLPLNLNDSVIKVEPGIGAAPFGDDQWSQSEDPLFHVTTKLEPVDYEEHRTDDDLEYETIAPNINSRQHSHSLRNRQRQRELQRRATAQNYQAHRNRSRRKNQKAARSRGFTIKSEPLCNICNKTFSRMTSLTYHMRSVHNIGTPLERKYECGTCGKSFLTKSHLTEHSRSHTGEKVYPCRYCDQRFRGTTGRKGHEETVHCIRDASFQDTCPNCPDITFTNSIQYRAHQRRMHPEELGIYGDSLEQLEDEDESGIIIKREIVDGEEGVEGEGQGLISIPKRRRTRYRKRAIPKDPNAPEDPNAPPKRKRQRKPKSTTPGEGGTSPGGTPAPPKERKPRVKKPKPPPLPPIIKPRVRRPPPLKLKCHYCDRMCPYESDRIRHENMVHLQLRTYLCESCGKGFKLPYQLHRHMESHVRLEAGPVECPFCPGKIFRAQQFLNTHLVKIHNQPPKTIQKPPIVYV